MEWMVADAVACEPVSRANPCKQGILQGIARFPAAIPRMRSQKWLRHSAILLDSLCDLTGIISSRSGNFAMQIRDVIRPAILTP